MPTINWLAQAVGAVGVAAFLLSFHVKSNKALLGLQMLANTLFGVQFVLLGAFSGCLSMGVLILRNLFILLRERYAWAGRRGWLYLFLLLFLACNLYTWSGPVSLLPLAASAGSTAAYWQNNARAYRTANLFCASPCWLAYDLLVGSYAGAVNETIALVSIISSIIRFGWKTLGENSFEKDGAEKP